MSFPCIPRLLGFRIREREKTREEREQRRGKERDMEGPSKEAGSKEAGVDFAM